MKIILFFDSIVPQIQLEGPGWLNELGRWI